MALLEVLDLFANPLELFLDSDHVLLDLRVIGLAADRICFTNHLLQDESESLPHRIRSLRLRGFAECGEMRPEPIELLRHVELVGENCNLLGNSLGICAGRAYQLRNSPSHTLVLLLEPDWRPLFYSGEPRFHRGHPLD